LVFLWGWAAWCRAGLRRVVGWEPWAGLGSLGLGSSRRLLGCFVLRSSRRLLSCIVLSHRLLSLE
jgi:hypothetical protein